MVGPRPLRLATDPDLESGGPYAAGLFCHPLQKIVPQAADLGGPGRVIHDYHKSPFVEPERLHVGGRCLTDDRRPLGEEAPEPLGVLDP